MNESYAGSYFINSNEKRYIIMNKQKTKKRLYSNKSCPKCNKKNYYFDQIEWLIVVIIAVDL